MYPIPVFVKKKLNHFKPDFFFDFISYAFLICIIFIMGAYSLWKAKHGIGDTDTAFFLDVIENTIRTGLPTSTAVGAFLNIVPYLDMTAAQYCAADFANVVNSAPVNILFGHANLIVYPMSAISYFIGPELTAAMANTFAFVGMPLIAYVYLRKGKTPSYLCFLFMIVLCAHPAWRISASGWFYFDRLFMPFALWYALSLHGPIVRREELSRLHMIGIVLIVITGALTHERAALLLLMFSLSSLIFFKGIPKKNIYFVLGISLGLCIYLGIYLFFQKNLDNQTVYKSFFSYDTFIKNIFQPGLTKLIFFNLIFLLAAIILEWRVAAIAALMLLPNVIVTMHGLEKDGWFTHYHSFYFPFVVYAGLIGIAHLSEYCRQKESINAYYWFYRLCPNVFLILVGLAMCFQNPYGKSMDWNVKYIMEGILTPIHDLYMVPAWTSSNRYETARADKLMALIPSGASVAQTPPFNTWKLFKNKNPISIFPVGIGKVDYLLLSFDKEPDNSIQFKINTLSPEYKQIQRCTTEKVWAAGYKEVIRIDNLMLLRHSQ